MNYTFSRIYELTHTYEKKEGVDARGGYVIRWEPSAPRKERIELEIDVEALVRKMGASAVSCKGKKSTLAGGIIKATILN